MNRVDWITLILASIQTIATIIGVIIAWRTHLFRLNRPKRRWSLAIVLFASAVEVFYIGFLVWITVALGWAALGLAAIPFLIGAGMFGAAVLLVREYRLAKEPTAHDS